MARDDRVVIGVDVGTTSTKAVAIGLDGTEVVGSSAGYALSTPAPGHAVQGPEQIVTAVITTLRATVRELSGRPVAGVAIGAAMHSLLGLDRENRPRTPLITWADARGTDVAERLRATPAGHRLHERTGTPVHAMSPMVKLRWFGEHEPAVVADVARWVGIKELVLLRLCGVLAVDTSTAAATGLLDLSTGAWDPEAMKVAGVDPSRLPAVVASTAVLPGLLPTVAAHVGLPAATPVVVGASDGTLATLGVGAVRPGVAACSIGTSGALRIMVDRPVVDARTDLFCYPLTDDRWVVGGAVNNGGSVLDWVGAALAPDLGDLSTAALLDLAGRVPPGADGLIMLPYLLGERTPRAGAHPRGAFVGLTRAHRREHLVRAAVEGVCLQFGVLLDTLRSAGHEVDEVRATGGVARSRLWRQVLADVLDLEVGFPTVQEGACLGAALLGMTVLGLIPSLEAAADLVQVAERTQPDSVAAATYASIRPVFGHLTEALAGVPMRSDG